MNDIIIKMVYSFSAYYIFDIFEKVGGVYTMHRQTDMHGKTDRQTDRQTLVLGGQTPDSRGMSEQSGANGRSLVS